MPCSQAEFDSNFPPDVNEGNALGGKVVYTTYAGSPATNLVPTHIGQWCFDTSNEDFYLATGLTNADWKQITA